MDYRDGGIGRRYGNGDWVVDSMYLSRIMQGDSTSVHNVFDYVSANPCSL